LSDNYEIGYKKPPKSGQFKKGKSGNPKGRPKNVKNKTPTQLLNLYLSTMVTVVENGDKKTITLLEALQRRLVAGALKGDAYAMRLIQKELQNIEKLRAKDVSEDQKTLIVKFV
jgi:Family of unknown function (DUF5681)